MRATTAIASLGLTIAVAATARAQPIDGQRGSVSFSTYVDEMDTVIYSPNVSAGATLPKEVDLDLTWKADIISSASVDVITAATPEINEQRQEIGLAAAREGIVANIDLTGGYTYSFEQDADSHVFELGGLRGFQQDNWTVGAKYGFSFNRLGIRNQPKVEWRHLSVHSADLSLARLLTRYTIAEARYSLYYLDGYQSSPYRRVPILLSDDLTGAMWVDERTPDKRIRHAFTVRGRSALSESWIASADYRFYFDDWGLMAHTVNGEQAWVVGGGLTMRMHQRVGYQSGADFYQMSYDEVMRHRTRDRRLSPHLNALVGASALYEIGELGPVGLVEAFLSGDLIAWRFNEFSRPVVTSTGTAELEPLGTVLGGVIQVGLQTRPWAGQ